jgi:hypothetical protein
MEEVVTIQQLKEVTRYIDQGIELLSDIAAHGIFVQSDHETESNFVDSLKENIQLKQNEI